MEWLEPWHAVGALGDQIAHALAQELRREVGPGHPLFEVPMEPIGKRDASDDVLFGLLDGSNRVAAVHLTWTHSPPERPPWPATEVYASFHEFACRRMRTDHEVFSA